MADFKTQVENLISFTVPADDIVQLNQFLKDGVIDVTKKCIDYNPSEVNSFLRESPEQIQNNVLDLNGARIISVIRENGANNEWRRCNPIPISSQYDVTDEESLNYASKIHPAYTIGDNGRISVFPVPSSGGSNSFKVHYVNNVPVNNNGEELINEHSNIKYFPSDKVYLVVLYAAIEQLSAKMQTYLITDEDVELVTSMASNLSALKAEYTSAFINQSKVQEAKA